MERDQRVAYDIWTRFAARRFRAASATPYDPPFGLSQFRIEAWLDENLRMRAVTRTTLKIGAKPLRAFAFEVSRAEQVTGRPHRWRPGRNCWSASPRAAARCAPTKTTSFLLTAPDLLAPGSVHQVEFEHEGALHHQFRQRSLFRRRALQLVSPQRLGIRGLRSGIPLSPPAHAGHPGRYRDGHRSTATGGSPSAAPPVPIRVAGFNLDDTKELRVRGRAHRGRVRKPHPRSGAATASASTTTITRVVRPGPRTAPRRRNDDHPSTAPPPDPSGPAERMVAIDVSACFQYFTGLFGPPPLKTLTVSPIPGPFGQGVPGLVYLSTLSYLDPKERPPRDAQRDPTDFLFGFDGGPRSRAPVVGQRGHREKLSGRVAARSAGPLLGAAVSSRRRKAPKPGGSHGGLPDRSAQNRRGQPDRGIGWARDLGLPPGSVQNIRGLPRHHLRERAPGFCICCGSGWAPSDF